MPGEIRTDVPGRAILRRFFSGIDTSIRTCREKEMDR
jgi:hypothetical protein